MEYNDENLRELYSQGLSQSEMGKRMGVTTGKVGGRIRRLMAWGKLDKRVKEKPLPAPPVVKANTYNRKGSIGIKPYGYKNPTKEELMDMLRRAVENTK